MKNKINLIPLELQKKEKKGLSFAKGNQSLLIKVAIILIILKSLTGITVARLKSDTNKADVEINSYVQKISLLEITVEKDLRSKKEKTDNIKLVIAEKEKELNDFGSIAIPALRKEKFIYALLKYVGEKIPNEVWLEELSLDKAENNFYLKGSSYAHSAIGEFLIGLGKSPFLKDLYMKYSETDDDKDTKQNLIKFEASGKISL